jgi:ribosomal-protein-serine acetyltransferase
VLRIPINNEISLKTYQRGDEAALFDAVERSRAHLARWLNWVNDTTRPEDSLEFIEHCLHQSDAQRELALGIWLGERVIGGIGMHQWDHASRRAQLGYWIDPMWEGKGIVRTGLTCFIQFLFQNAGLQKLEIHYVAANSRSARVAESLGFRIEGIIRQSYVRNGLVEDLVITGLLKEEWMRNGGSLK